MKRLFTLLAILAILSSCRSGGRVYSKNQDLSPQAEWLKKDSREFKVPVKDISTLYNLKMTCRYVDGYQYQFVKVKVTETSPGGKKSVQEYDLKVRKDNGDYIGEAGLDIWDSDHLVGKNMKFEETGIYTFLVEQNMPVDPLTSVMEIGLILEKVK